MTDARSRCAQACDLFRFEVNAVCEPYVIREPLAVLEIVDGPHAVSLQAPGVFVVRFAQMRMQADTGTPREPGALAHELG